MKNNLKRYVYGFTEVLGWLFFLLMAAQIILGTGWMFLNLGKPAMFHETDNYVKAAENLIIDEYMGILYPLIIRFGMVVEGMISVPYYTVVYIVQLGTALYAGIYLLKRTNGCKPVRNDNRESRKAMIKSSGRTAFYVAYLLTFPLLLQMHLAVLPESFAASLTMILVSDGIYYWKNSDLINGRVLIRLCGLWMLCAILKPEYIWMLGLFVGLLFLKAVLQNREWLLRLCVALCSTVLCFGVISQSTQIPGSMGRMQKSVGSAMVLRFVWPDFLVNSFFWEKEISETFEAEELVRFSRYPEAVIYEFGPILEAKYGKKTADTLYRNMALTNIKLGTRQALRNVGRDFLVNVFPQISVQKQLADNESSLSGWNYGRFQENAPVLTKYYLRISFAGWNVMCSIGAVLLTAVVVGDFKKRRRQLIIGLPIVALIVFMAAWYALSTSIQDYKNVTLICLFWTIAVLKIDQKLKGLNNIKEGKNDEQYSGEQ